MTDKIKIATCLWFNKNAEEAAKFYAETFPNSRVNAVYKSPSDRPDAATAKRAMSAMIDDEEDRHRRH
jgi:predicted 3-demethylubiquinone-9 3-methyltransferase (glyoxalase superfamily)